MSTIGVQKNKTLPSFTGNIFPFTGFRKQAIVLIFIGFIFYFNSFFNEYALDDGIVITKNEYVQQGFKGIGKIFSTDAYESYYRQMNSKAQLSGGRYRPLSIVTFAIEQELFGNNTLIRHFLNVALYIASVVLLLYFLQNFIFKDQPDIAFLISLLFLIHPVHTEVIANVKSRDEILSLLFILLTFIFAFRYEENKKVFSLGIALVCYFLALLSKEYGITLLLLIPVIFYITKNYNIKRSVLSALPFTAIALLYLAIRFNIVGLSHIENKEVLNNPFIYASSPEKWATKISILNNYLKLIFFPHPLSSDYSYNQIPYKNFSNISVWFSLAMHLAMIIASIVLLKKRHILAFALLFYLAYLLLVSNFIMDIGATMGERLIYHSSLGMSILIGYIAIKGLEKWKIELFKKRFLLLSVLGVIVILCGYKTIERNAVWKNDITLFTTDVATVPNSVLANGNAGARYIDLSEKPENKAKEQELMNKAIFHLNKSIKIHPGYVNGYINLGIAYYKLHDLHQAEMNWNTVKKMYPTHPVLKTLYPLLASQYLNEGLIFGSKKEYEKAIGKMMKASEVDPENAEIWYNLGGACFTIKKYDKAREAWEKTIQLNPNHKDALRGLDALKIIKYSELYK